MRSMPKAPATVTVALPSPTQMKQLAQGTVVVVGTVAAIRLTVSVIHRIGEIKQNKQLKKLKKQVAQLEARVAELEGR